MIMRVSRRPQRLDRDLEAGLAQCRNQNQASVSSPEVGSSVMNRSKWSSRAESGLSAMLRISLGIMIGNMPRRNRPHHQCLSESTSWSEADLQRHDQKQPSTSWSEATSTSWSEATLSVMIRSNPQRRVQKPPQRRDQKLPSASWSEATSTSWSEATLSVMIRSNPQRRVQKPPQRRDQKHPHPQRLDQKQSQRRDQKQASTSWSEATLSVVIRSNPQCRDQKQPQRRDQKQASTSWSEATLSVVVDISNTHSGF